MAAMGDYSCHYQSNANTKLLIDSGSTDNMCSESLANRHNMVIDKSPRGLRTYEQMNGTRVTATATAWWETRILGQEMTVEFAVLPEMGTDKAVLGYTWLRDWEVKQDFGTGDLELGRNTPIGKTLSRIAKEMIHTAHIDKKKAMEGKTWQQVIPKIYHKYAKAFDRPSDRGELPRSTQFNCKLTMKPGWKRWHAQYTPDRSEAEKKVEADIIEDCLKRHSIEEIWDPIVTCATVFAKKKGGGTRYCQDYKGLNENTESYPYKIKDMEDMIQRATGWKEYGQFDLKDEFYTVRMDEGSKKYTTFEALGRTFRWNVMPFGLKQAPGIWSAYAAWVFDRVHLDERITKEFGTVKNPDQWLCVYMDDILTYANTRQEMERYNAIILRTCELHGFTVNWEKSEPHVQEALFCRVLIGQNGCKIDPAKYKMLQEYPRPTSAKMGIKWRATLQFNRKHYARLHTIIEPITKMFKKVVKWEWGTEQETA